MNPNIPSQRGCFIDKRVPEKFTLVDYPTWSAKNGRFVDGPLNKPFPDDVPYMKEFNTLVEAVKFAKSENYVICTDPWTKPKFEKPKKADREDED